jgi:hypothetical protein
MSDKKYVTYEEFGAVGDGVTEDFAAIKKAHDYANKAGLPVRARDDATYYIHFTDVDGEVAEAIIKTDVNWGNAKFIVDDRDISPVDADATSKYSHKAIFNIVSDYPEVKITDKETLERVAARGIKPGTKKIDLGLGYPAMIAPFDTVFEDKVYRRRGYGGFSGMDRHEVIVIDKDGNVSDETPIMFEYPTLEYIRVFRDDVKPITVEGGTFTTRASRVNVVRDIGGGRTNEMGGYIQRNIKISRSHTTLRKIKHYVTDEITIKEQIKDGDYIHVSSTYWGFFSASWANQVFIVDSILTGRRCYGRPKNCKENGTGGTYDFAAENVNKIVLKNCHQSNFWIKYDENYDITPCGENDEGAVPSIMLQYIQGLPVKVIWGIGGTNFCKNMEYIDSTLSRFDAHSGLYNGKIINSSVNVMALTGVGDFIVENTKWFAADPLYIFNALFHFRWDYGSTWQGDIKVKNLKAYFFDNENISVYYHGFSNWYYGYGCYVPNFEFDGVEAYYIDSRKPLREGTKINLCGPGVFYEPAMHLSETKNVQAVFPYIDLDGDGLVDGTNVPYDKEYVKNSNSYQQGLCCGSYKNLNIITPPSIFKVKNLMKGIQFGVPKTSVFEDCEGGFFGKTKFYTSDEDYILGTDHEDNETFAFCGLEQFKGMN